MPIVEFETLQAMSSFIDELQKGSFFAVYKPTSYARQNNISRQGVVKRCKNSGTIYYLRCPSERHVLLVDTVNRIE